MDIEALEIKYSIKKTVITHFLMWFLYLILQLWWRFESYGFYVLLLATIQVMTWAALFYTVRLYLYPKYLWKNHWRLALALLLIYPIFQVITIFYINYIILYEGMTEPITIFLHIKRASFWYFNISFVAFGLTYYDELGKEKLRRQIIESELQKTQLTLKKSELENLKAQFNPHFLFNTLWYIFSLVQETGSIDATKAVGLLSTMMRYSMQNRQVNEFVFLEEELNYARNYIELQRLRTPMMQLDYQINGDVTGVKILPLTLIAFVENACKHGKLNEEENPLIVHLTIKENKDIYFFVKNKISTLSKERSSGIGVGNVKNRLKTAYGDKYSLTLIDDEGFYTSELNIKS
jgi:two-component system, LytTR family, sensor kinase